LQKLICKLTTHQNTNLLNIMQTGHPLSNLLLAKHHTYCTVKTKLLW